MKRCSTSVITQLIPDHNEVQPSTHQNSYHQKEKIKKTSVGDNFLILLVRI